MINFSKNKIHSLWVALCLLIILLPFQALAADAPKKQKQRPFTVVIDAGHGGKDIGAADNGAREKDINLAVAKKTAEILSKKLKDAKVILTRNDDYFLTLQERADVANKAKADLFISVHTNSLDKTNKNRTTTEGASTYALGLHKEANNMKVAQRENSVIELENGYEERYSGFDPNSDESYIIFEMAQKKNLSKSIKFAKSVQDEFRGVGRLDRGVHQAGFWVLWATSMPAVLVELDFICNPKSAKYLTSEKGVKELAGSIAKAVEKYQKQWSHEKESRAMETTDKQVEVAEYVAESVEAGEELPRELVSVSKPAKKRVSEASRNYNSEYSTARPRRRRSSRAKAASDARDVETSNIPVSDPNARVARTVVAAAPAPAPEPKAQEEGKSKKNKKKKKSKSSHKARRDKMTTVYKIQVLASPNKFKETDPRFCGLAPISITRENNLYKYTYGETETKSEIETLLKKVRKLIPDAFIVQGLRAADSKQ